MTEPDDHVIVRYPPAMKALMLIGPWLLGGLAAFALALAIESSGEGVNLGVLLFAGLGLLLLHVSWVGLRALPYWNVAMHVSDSGFHLLRGGASRFVAWSEIGRVKRHALAQMLTVRDRSGRVLFMISDQIPGGTTLSSLLDTHVEGGRRES